MLHYRIVTFAVLTEIRDRETLILRRFSLSRKSKNIHMFIFMNAFGKGNLDS